LIDLVRRRPIDYGQDAAHWTSFGEEALSFAVPCLWNTPPADTWHQKIRHCWHSRRNFK